MFGSALADRDVSITLLHDFGDGMVPAGTVTGTLPETVSLLAHPFSSLLHHASLQPCIRYSFSGVSFSVPDRVQSVQILHKQKLSIEWNVGEDAVERLKKLAINDECDTITPACLPRVWVLWAASMLIVSTDRISNLTNSAQVLLNENRKPRGSRIGGHSTVLHSS